MEFKIINYDSTQIASIVTDVNNGEFLWVGFKKSGNYCRLLKTSAHDISQVYFEIFLPVNSIDKLEVFSSNLYIAVDHSTIALYILSLATPLTSQVTYTKAELDIQEKFIGITKNNTDLYFLTPGELSGVPARLVVFESGEYLETVELMISNMEVRSAVSLTIDASNNIWIIDSGNPATLYRVYKDTIWNLQETVLY